MDVATLTQLNNTEGTSYLQKHSKFNGIDLRLTSDLDQGGIREEIIPGGNYKDFLNCGVYFKVFFL